MATTYSQPQNENREENDFHLFTGSIMDPFKTGPTGLFAMALVSLGKSGRFSLGVVPKPTAIANRPVSFDAMSQFTKWPRFNQLRDGQKLPKNRYGESVLTQIAKIKMTGSIMVRSKK